MRFFKALNGAGPLSGFVGRNRQGEGRCRNGNGSLKINVTTTAESPTRIQHFRQASQAATPITEILSRSSHNEGDDNGSSPSDSEMSSMLYEDYSLGIDTRKSWLATSTSAITTSNSHTPGRNIQLDFAPTVSYELWVDADVQREHGRVGEGNPHLYRPSQSQSQSRQRNPRIRQRPQTASTANQNPYDAFLSEKYDRQRIEQNLERLLFGSDTDIYSFTYTDRDDHDSVDSFSRRFPLHQEEISKGGRDDSIGVVEKIVEEETYTFENEDIRSVNNAIATRNLISAPRLLEGTKNIPSMIKIETFDDDDDNNDNDNGKGKYGKHMDIIHDIGESPSIEVRPTSTGTHINTSIFKPSSTAPNQLDQEDEQTKRTRITTASSSFGYSSYESSTKWKERVGQFDERRPWRKYRSESRSSSRSSSVPTRTRTDTRLHDRYRISTPSQWRGVDQNASHHDHLPARALAIVREISTKLEALDLDLGYSSRSIGKGEEQPTKALALGPVLDTSTDTVAVDQTHAYESTHPYSYTHTRTAQKDHTNTSTLLPNTHKHAPPTYSNKVKSIKTRLRAIERQASQSIPVSTVRR